MSGIRSSQVHGRVVPGFEAVREVFAENFVQRRELGGACCAYVVSAVREEGELIGWNP